MKYLSDHDGDFDVVFNHMRAGYLFLPLAQKLSTPIISTLHLPLFDEVVDVLSNFDCPNYVSISNNQRKPAKNKVNFLGTVYNGLDLDEFEFNESPKDYFVFMGAMGEHKNPHIAIEAARKAGVKLILIGGKKREPYFSEKILPFVDKSNIEYLGEVSGPERVRVLKNAKGLFPSTGRNPLVSGYRVYGLWYSVIAFNRSAMNEIIDNGKDGFIVNNTNEMVEAIRRIGKIDRRLCHKKVEDKFTYKRMTDGYLQVLEKIKIRGM